jgi:heme/copper-type cytochrome/quinol oxidase subunit 3
MEDNEPIRSVEGGMGRGLVPPRGMGVFGMGLFLAALGMLFAASMVAYVAIRLGPGGAARGGVHLPIELWFSTGLILLSSFAFHGAVLAIRRERLGRFRGYLWATFGLALGFIAVQTPGLLNLLRQHRSMAGQGIHHLYGLVFFLVLLHALHVVGGIVAMAQVNVHAKRGRYDHEHYFGVRYAAMYWHFLDAVWLAMFAVFLATG